MSWSELLNIVLGGGLVSLVVALTTMRSNMRKAGAEAVKAEADAESVRLDNTEHATRILMEHIVKPLKEELDETRRQIELLKRSIYRLRKAIDTANNCRHHDDCPVLAGMRDESKGYRGNQPGADIRNPPDRQHAHNQDADRDDTAAAEGDACDDSTDGQPPPAA